jgi:predicted metal-dependent phosphoesterase TrpH
MKTVDMHLHTLYSDGTNSARQIVAEAALRGLDAIAITDHDITSAYKKAKSEAEKWGIEVISGVELSAQDYHILGYGFKVDDKQFQELLAYSRQCQERIVQKRIEKLKQKDVPINMQKIKQYFPDSRIGKMNLVMTLMMDRESREYHHAHGIADIFEHYMKEKGELWVPESEELASNVAIDGIHKAGGIAVIAHPFKQITDMAKLDELVALGLDGVEMQPNYKEKNDPFREYAKQRGLLITYGSDFHGVYMPHRLMLGKNGNQIEPFWK